MVARQAAKAGTSRLRIASFPASTKTLRSLDRSSSLARSENAAGELDAAAVERDLPPVVVAPEILRRQPRLRAAP